MVYLHFININRNEHSCRERYSHIDPDKSVNAFSDEEDYIIGRLVSIFGFGKWSTIANYIPNRTDRQIADRYKTITGEFDVLSKKNTEIHESNKILFLIVLCLFIYNYF